MAVRAEPHELRRIQVPGPGRNRAVTAGAAAKPGGTGSCGREHADRPGRPLRRPHARHVGITAAGCASLQALWTRAPDDDVPWHIAPSGAVSGDILRNRRLPLGSAPRRTRRTTPRAIVATRLVPRWRLEWRRGATRVSYGGGWDAVQSTRHRESPGRLRDTVRANSWVRSSRRYPQGPADDRHLWRMGRPRRCVHNER